ncbi:MAG: hypothetical protein ACYC6Y_30680 [Thermoguttaceae bacterium]
MHQSGVAPVAAIYVEDHRSIDGPTGPKVVVAVWRDGVVIWSANQQEGGSPYFTARLPSTTVGSVLRQLDAEGLFNDPVRSDRYFGPDAGFTTLAICDGSHRLRMSSWHEQFERNGNLVALASGVTALNGRSRDQLLAQEPEEYRHFRQAWNTVRSALTSMVPNERRPLEDCTFTLQPQPAVISPTQGVNH